MITADDVGRLAHLARIEVPEGEIAKLAKDMDEILAYVGEVSKAAREDGLPSLGGGIGVQVGHLKNVFREDVPTCEPGQYTEDILANAPAREGNYIKVKKIL